MGQKCSCIGTEDDSKIETRLEHEILNIVEITENPSHREELKNNESFIEEKFKPKSEFHNNLNLSERNKQNSTNLESNYILKTDNSFSEQKLEFIKKKTLEKKATQKEIDIRKVDLIKRNMANWFYRKRFLEQVKDGLVEDNERLFNDLFNSENVRKLEALSAKSKKAFNLDDWKKFYSEFPINLSNICFSAQKGQKLKGKTGFNFDFDLIYGKTFQSRKIFLGKKNVLSSFNIGENCNDNRSNANNKQRNNNLVAVKDKSKNYKNDNINNNDSVDGVSNQKNKEGKNYLYIGSVNKNNQKHGKGVLYNLDGSSREEGTWFEDELIGWVRVIFSAADGLVLEGKLKKKFYFNLFVFKNLQGVT